MFPVRFDFQKLKAVSRLIAMASFTLDVVCNHLPLHHTHTHTLTFAFKDISVFIWSASIFPFVISI